MKNILLIFIFITTSLSVSAQQTPNPSLFNQTKAYWNPAATAYGENLVINTLLRKQWVSFKGTPATGFVDYQYPFVDYNMSVGGMASFDKTGPFSKINIQANYAYKLKEILGEDSQLSIGLSAGVQSYSFNAGNEIYNDEGDPLVTDIGGAFTPSVGVGMFYISNTDKWRGNSFYTGFAVNQIMESSILKGFSNQKRRRHITADIGTKIYNYNSYIEPSLTLSYVNPEIIDLLVGVKYELRDAFWAGVGYSSSKELALQGGIVIDNINGKFSQLRVGALFNLGITQAVKQFGPGFELLVNYEFEMR